ncbi:M14 family metallopeptidase [Kistimonas asteriae]|uniref:M14 family metallopeptidase n=1 Tax=Kistimonas asteriae TaxID=517724 RepID=UPI001BA9F5E7|nr:M14 family metallopeptidase [Kistimonas asteriae]
MKRLATQTSDIRIINLNEKTPEGRNMVMAVVSTSQDKTPKGLKESGKPTVLIESGIHPGEVNGKDAGLMLLRDLTVGKQYPGLLKKVNVLFIPAVNPDGDMRRSAYSRINQNGPDVTGWRLNANNLNLNRDFTKLDSPEIRNVVNVMATWDPDFFMDVHSTDGINYQYDVTYCDNGNGWSPAAKAWMDKSMTPKVYKDLKAMGHIPNVCISANDNSDITKGYYPYSSDLARFSNQYGDIRGIPSILVELHALKPYKQQVLGNYVLYKSILESVAADPKGLKNAAEKDHAMRPARTVLTWKAPEKVPDVEFKGVTYETEKSPITGDDVVIWSNKPKTYTVPLTGMTEPDLIIKRPKAYVIPVQWQSIIKRLKEHGINMTVFKQPTTLNVTVYRMKDIRLGVGFEPDRAGGAKLPGYEGRLLITGTPVPVKRRVTYPAGSVEVFTDQRLGTLAMNLLEPRSPDSFLQWGFFNSMMTTGEEPERYVMEPMARAMLKQDPKLEAAFKAKLKSDKTFANDPNARLMWFFEHTPYIDANRYLYPIGVIPS